MSTTPAITSTTEALDLLDGALAYLTAADPTQLPAVIQARCLTALERADARATAARASNLAAFTAGQAGAAGPGRAGGGDGRPVPPDQDGPRFGDRAVRLETTFGGAGVLHADLTPECAAVLDALSAPRGAEDERTHGLRYHDALEDAMRRLVAAGLLPERAGQPVKVWAHISLADLLALDAESALQDEWTARVCRQWAAHRAAASAGGSDGSAWLDGDDAEAVACDASVTPVVLGTVNPGVLEDLIRYCLELAGHGPGHCTPAPRAPVHTDPDRSSPAPRDPGPGEPLPGPQLLPAGLSREALEQNIIGAAIKLLSGPGGLASFLRRRELGARLGGPSQPLDIGYSSDIPAAIRNAVKLRDRHCQWAGGCDQPASACEVHHLRHKGHGGKTSLDNCCLLCFFHHQVVIHRMGWTLVRNPDGTTTAWNPDRTKVLRSHSPPARAG